MQAGWVPEFSWLQPDLAVGAAFPSEAAERLACEHGVGAVIDVRAELCDDAEYLAGCGLRFLHLPTLDMCAVSQPMLDAGVAFAEEAERRGHKLLVHCEHGIGRSATVALCILAARGFAPMEALRLAKDARTLISPSFPQYEAWIAWLARRGLAPRPSYEEFGMIVYRHLTASA
jgi:hypothetical protein